MFLTVTEFSWPPKACPGTQVEPLLPWVINWLSRSLTWIEIYLLTIYPTILAHGAAVCQALCSAPGTNRCPASPAACGPVREPEQEAINHTGSNRDLCEGGKADALRLRGSRMGASVRRGFLRGIQKGLGWAGLVDSRSTPFLRSEIHYSFQHSFTPSLVEIYIINNHRGLETETQRQCP